MNRQILEELLQEYREQQNRNAREEDKRLRAAAAACPEIEKLIRARHEMILTGVRSVFQGGAADAESKMLAYNERIAELLRANGFPADYLAPVYRCPICRDTGYAGEPLRRPCECLKASYAQRLAGTGRTALDEQTFENYSDEIYPDEVIDDLGVSQRAYMRKVRALCQRYADDYPLPARPNLLLTGGSGLGKTYLLSCIANRVRQRGSQAVYVTAYQLLNILKNAYFTRDESEARAFFDTGLLLIDDLGMEPMMANITVEQVFNLLNERITAGLCTAVSTNLSISEIKERYTERVSSRLMDSRGCQIIPLSGRDVRLQKTPPEAPRKV